MWAPRPAEQIGCDLKANGGRDTLKQGEVGKNRERSVDSWQESISKLSCSVFLSLRWCAICIGVWTENRGRQGGRLGRDKWRERRNRGAPCQNLKLREERRISEAVHCESRKRQ